MMHLILLHGNLGSPRDWEPCLPLWRHHGIRCHPVDLWEMLSHGPISLEAAGEKIRALAPDGEPCMLAGYSLGGRLALHAAQGGFWQGLVLLSANPGLADEAERARRLAADRCWAELCLNASPGELIAQWNAQSVFEGGSNDFPPPEYDPQRVSLAWDCWSLGRQRDCSAWLTSTSLPLLWLTGERDPRFTAMATACRPDAVRVLPGAGHRLLRDAPGAVARHILDFALSLQCPAQH